MGRGGKQGGVGVKEGHKYTENMLRFLQFLWSLFFLCLPPPDFLSTHHRHILTTDNNHKHYNYIVGLYNFIRGLGGEGEGL